MKKVSSSIFLYISRSYFRDVILMIGSTVYIAQWTLSALYRRPGKGFPYRFSAILLGCVFFFFVSSSCVFILVRCLFFLLYGETSSNCPAGCWLLDVFLYYSMDPALCCDWSVSTTFFHPFWSSSLRPSDVLRKKREQTGAHGARETAAYIAWRADV